MIELKEAFRQQRSNASGRGIEFLLTFDEWLEIWTNSGHLEMRGKRAGHYCMARIGDTGPYAVGNVEIIPFGDNVRIAQLGTKKSEATKTKMVLARAKQQSRPLTQEHKDRISAAFKGRALTDEHRRKIAEAHTGKTRKPFSEAHRKKLSEAMHRRYAGST